MGTFMYYVIAKRNQKNPNHVICTFRILQEFHDHGILIKFFKDYDQNSPPVDLHWFFEISIRTEKKFRGHLFLEEF